MPTSTNDSTKLILVSLTKNHLGVNKIPSDNKGLRRATVTMATLGKTTQEINQAGYSAQAAQALQTTLSQLETIATPSAKENHKLYSSQAKPLLEKAEQEKTTFSLLLDKFNQLKTNIANNIKTLLTTVENASNPAEKALSQEIVNQFKTLETKRDSFLTEFNQFTKNSLATSAQLSRIQHDAYSALTPDKRAQVPTPANLRLSDYR